MQDSETALHVASEHDRTDVVSLLLERGADINAVDQVCVGCVNLGYCGSPVDSYVIVVGFV